MARQKTRYALVGAGGRSGMYREAILATYAGRCELVALCDRNRGRLERAVGLARAAGSDVPAYSDRQFTRLVKETAPDCVIVCTQDSCHDRYIVKAMELGCDVITEKPMTIDARRCQAIVDTQRRTGQRVRVTFNYRYSPPRTQVMDLLMKGTIGEVLSVDFHWMLNTSHGADYYRRWHRNKRNSGGLLVHKATHHFDLVNWWLGSVPERVFASGHRRFYTPETADRYGLKRRTDRCHTCPETGRCRFALDLAANEELAALYLACEAYDGYHRDQCVFGEDIDIEDAMSVAVDYANGAKLSYSLNSFAPWEGYVVTFNGTRGRLEHKCEETVYINGDGSVPGALRKEGTWIKVYPHWRGAYQVDLWTAAGGHGGADPVMLEYIFGPKRNRTDRYRRAADQRAGAYSILTGIAANRSIRTGRAVTVSDLVSGIGLPDYPRMPSPDARLLFPPPTKT